MPDTFTKIIVLSNFIFDSHVIFLYIYIEMYVCIYCIYTHTMHALVRAVACELCVWSIVRATVCSYVCVIYCTRYCL